MANIRLNILPISESDFSFKVFRKLKQEEDTKEDDIYFYHLPENSDLTKRKGYWVSFLPREGFEEFENHSFYAIGLTKRFLTEQLLNTLTIKGCPFPYNVYRRFTEEKIEFTIHEFVKGKQIIYLSPFYFEEQKRFGFIIDFRFSRNKELQFDKEVQILSLSLDSQGRSNKNYYSDKFRLIQSFLDKVYSNIQIIREGENNLLHIERELIETPVFQLNKKEYIFSNKSTANSQFQGITFPGFEQMFGVVLNTSNVKQIKIEGFSNEQLLSIVDKVKTYQETEPNKKVIGIYIEDYATDTEDIVASNHYYFMKYNFIKNNLPLQVVNYRKLSEKNSLKWSTSNVALAMFAKMGGIPWVVKPSNNNCLILGVGSSHKRNEETGEITKYFAYTVCLDSSGLYKTLEVLADETSETNYLQKLKSNLIKLLKDSRMSDYKTCVLHLPFKIKQNEISAISEAIKQIDDIEFVAIKVNLDNKYFGYSFHNTFVPYESSFVKLSRNEYLVWFEGLLYGKEVVDKRLANPVHIQFLNLGNQKGFDERKYLQDVLNLSGANWRGFNAKSIPISIYYSQIIAKYSEAFEKIDGYEENSISNDKPWFL
ncbi:MAG: hypothetical protein HYU68_02070 [Bacteroidetes bacterium]|nr:hypothetical protein [Bacteroidota bacterium]